MNDPEDREPWQEGHLTGVTLEQGGGGRYSSHGDTECASHWLSPHRSQKTVPVLWFMHLSPWVPEEVGEGAERRFAGARRRHPARVPLTQPEVALKVTPTLRCQVRLCLIRTCYPRTSLLLSISPFPSILERSQRKPHVCSLTSLYQDAGCEPCSGLVRWTLVVQSFVLVCREAGRRPRYPRPHPPERSRSRDGCSTVLCEILSEESFPLSASGP